MRLVNLILKFILDYFLAIFFFILFFLPLVVISLLIFLIDGRPVFFIQERAGIYGRKLKYLNLKL